MYQRGLYSSQIISMFLCFCVLNQGDCVSRVRDTHMCIHAHYKWKSREYRHCLIHQDLSSFLVFTTMAIILDNTMHAPPLTPFKIMVEQILSLVLGALQTEITLFKSFGDSTVPNILILNMRFAFKWYVVKKRERTVILFLPDAAANQEPGCCSPNGADFRI